MAGRKFKEREPEILENILKESLGIIGVEMEEGKSKLLLRLLTSGIAYHYFKNPDDLIKVGFLQFRKSPEKNELFKVTLLKDKESGVINAETLWQYYKGELRQKAQFKQVLENFLEELITYSQEQEIDITQLTSKLREKKRKGA